MLEELIIAGFGGQGVLSAGAILTHAAMDHGLEAAWIPSYGPEMRGGTANCTVIVSDELIGSPVTTHPSAVIVMNLPSFERFEPIVRPGGFLIVNQSLIAARSKRSEIHTIYVPAGEIATGAGSPLVACVVALGALIAATSLVPAYRVEEALASTLPSHRRHLIPINVGGFRAGLEWALPAAV